jgi:ferredoxin-NADP reductase
MALEQFELRLQQSVKTTPNTLHLEFVRVDGKPLNFIAGQFITLLLTDKEGVLKRRSYSISSYPGSDTLSIAISFVKGGIATETLFNLKPGDTVKGMGPAGRLVLQDESIQRYILAGTGTGIAPYRSMLPEIARRIKDSNLKIDLVLGVQFRADLLYGPDFVEFAKAHPNFTFHAQYSRETATDLQAYEHQGYVQTAFMRLNLNPANDIVYLCGNPNMIDEAFKELTESYGFATSNIRREKYISSN